MKLPILEMNCRGIIDGLIVAVKYQSVVSMMPSRLRRLLSNFVLARRYQRRDSRCHVSRSKYYLRASLGPRGEPAVFKEFINGH